MGIGPGVNQRWRRGGFTRLSLLECDGVRTWTLLPLLGATACGPGAAGKHVRPEAPSYGDATGAVACSGVPNLARPLAVDWRPEDRADLEVAMKQGVAVVAYDCKQARILRDCRVDGSYGFIGTTLKEQVVHLTGADEIRLNLPFFGARLGGGVQRGASLDAAMAIVGEQVASIPVVAKSDLAGDCAGATHFVREATVGAFVTHQNATGKTEAAADILSMGATGSSTSSKEIVNSDGDPKECRVADPSSKSPSPRCSSLLRLELKSIATSPVRLGYDPFSEYATENNCPTGAVFEAGKCGRAKASVPHLCSYGEGRDCDEQCQRGNAASCTRLGLMHERGEGVAKDVSKAAALYDKACQGDDVPACSRFGSMLTEGLGVAQDGKRGRSFLHKACAAGWSRACTAEMAQFAKEHAGDTTPLIPLMQRACDGGDGDACASLGMMYQEGLGFEKDEERAAYFLKRGCRAGSKFGCVLLGEAFENGIGVEKDAERAAELFTMACEAKDSEACDREAKLYFLGDGVTQNNAKAIELLGRACDLGNTGSCLVLGMRYDHGTGVARDKAKGAKLLKRACDGGVSAACDLLHAK